MTSAPATPQRHRMTVHRSRVPFLVNHRRISCCDDSDSPFSYYWNNRITSQSQYPILGTPSEVIDLILRHVTQGRDDSHTAATEAMVRGMVGLSDNVIDGLKMLRQQLDFVTLKFRYLDSQE